MNGATELSKALGDAVAAAQGSVVQVHAGRADGVSGLVWDKDLVVTAAHALERDESVRVSAGGEHFEAKVVGVDPATDLAVLRVGVELSPLAHADVAALRVGELVLGLSRSSRGLKARLGIVSRVGGELRLGGGARIERSVETDLFPGPVLVGGALVRADGALVGVAAPGLLRGTVLALPPVTVERIVGSIVTHGRVRRARVGVGLERVELPRALAERRGQKRGLLVLSALEGSPAERGGVLLGDVILAADGRATERVDDLMAVLDESRIGVALPLDILRAGAEHSVTLEPEAR